jgi:pantoate--beta-alanine ligase
LNIVRPNIAYFGLKDLQQCLVLLRMVDDLNMPVRLSLQPTVREADGLAMSSRNAYLTQEERHLAPLIFNQLSACKQLLLSSDHKHETVEKALKQAKMTLEDAGFRVDYFELIELENTHAVRSLSMPCALIAAARLGKTRLIDNIVLSDSAENLAR